jgi:hypothetical protein
MSTITFAENASREGILAEKYKNIDCDRFGVWCCQAVSGVKEDRV